MLNRFARGGNFKQLEDILIEKKGYTYKKLNGKTNKKW